MEAGDGETPPLVDTVVALAARAAGHWSSSRTCEAGLSRAMGARYRSFVHLVERATRPLSS